MSADVPSDPGASPTGAGVPGEEPATDEAQADGLEAATARLAEIAASLQQWLDVQVARAHVEFREKAFRLLAWGLLLVLLCSMTVVATVYLLRGISGFLTDELAGLPWAGDLAAGVLGLLLVAAIGTGVRSSLRRRNLRRMQAKFNASPRSPAEEE